MECLGQQWLGSGGVFHEVEDEDVIEVATNLLLVVEIGAIMKFSEFKNHFYSFGLVFSGQTSVLFAVENSLAAFVDQMWTDWVLCPVQGPIEVLLLGKEDDSAEVGEFAGLRVTVFLHGALDVIPDIRGVIAVEVNDRFWQILNSLEVDPALWVRINGGLLLRELRVGGDI